MATQLNNSKAEDNFADLLESKYGLIEGWLDEDGQLVEGHFVREHTFTRQFTSYEERDGQGQEEQYSTRVDFWFPQWSIAVEFKAAPLGRHYDNRALARRGVRALELRGRNLHEQHTASWSNQLAKFQGIAEQAHEDAETSSILWILVDDKQVSTAPGNIKKYSYRKMHQVNALRETHRDGYGWNPMGQRECGRLLWMYKEVSELSGQRWCDSLHGAGCYNRLPAMVQVLWNVRVENTKRMILPELHKLDTTEGLHLVLDHELLADAEGLLLADGETEPEVGELMRAGTMPLLVPPQNGQRALR